MVPVRVTRESDAAEFARLCAQWGYPIGEERCSTCISKVLASKNEGLNSAEFEPGNLVGWAHVQTRDIIAASSFGEIVGIVVDESSRRRGVGRVLIDRCVQWSLEQGIDKMHVKSNSIRSEAHSFYPNIGYELEKTQHSYRREWPVGNP